MKNDNEHKYRAHFHAAKNHLWQLLVVVDFLRENTELNPELSLEQKKHILKSINEISKAGEDLDASMTQMNTHAHTIMKECKCGSTGNKTT